MRFDLYLCGSTDICVSSSLFFVILFLNTEFVAISVQYIKCNLLPRYTAIRDALSQFNNLEKKIAAKLYQVSNKFETPCDIAETNCTKIA